jgi:hypothetical protein
LRLRVYLHRVASLCLISFRDAVVHIRLSFLQPDGSKDAGLVIGTLSPNHLQG